jgi:glycosyltransferase involved in cell wall biosynthesis
MATYNGEKYIENQIYSILDQLKESDELIISDDNSSDKTIEIIKSIIDNRITIIENKENIGYIKNFERLLPLPKHNYIFLSDQDDIWPENRITLMLNAFEQSKKSVVVGNHKEFSSGSIDEYLETKLDIMSNKRYYKNIIKIFLGAKVPYYGSCMAMNKDSLDYILPFPGTKTSHDIWIALVSNLNKEIYHIQDIVTYRRIHSKNITNKNRSLLEKLITRWHWLKDIL